MQRKDILQTTENILKFLSDKKQHSVQSISVKLKIQWRTTIKSLEFLKKINLVKEQKGKTAYKPERLFSLK